MSVRLKRDITRKSPSSEFEDTAILSLSKIDRQRLSMDSWEPSLLRKLLTAQNQLKKRK